MRRNSCNGRLRESGAAQAESLALKSFGSMKLRNRRGVIDGGNNTMSEVAQSVAGDSNSSVEKAQSNITAGEYAIRRLGELKARSSNAPKAQSDDPQQPVSKALPEVEEKEQNTLPKEEGNVTTDSKTDGKDVLSQVDLSELTDDDIAELAQKGKSGLLKRIAELTARRKMAEEKSAQMEAYIQQQKKDPLEAKVENNPYASIKTVEDLTSKSHEINEVIEWAEEVLDRAEHLGYEDIAATVDGNDLTKSQVKDHLRRARKARDKFLPAQKKELDAMGQRKGLKSAFEQQALKELDWLASSEDNDLKRQYQAMMSDPRLKNIEDSLPDIAPQLPYLLAHAANSMYGRKLIPLAQQPKVSPPNSPDSTAAGSGRGEKTSDRNVKEASQRLSDSGSISDFVALRTAKLSQRR